MIELSKKYIISKEKYEEMNKLDTLLRHEAYILYQRSTVLAELQKKLYGILEKCAVEE